MADKKGFNEYFSNIIQLLISLKVKHALYTSCLFDPLNTEDPEGYFMECINIRNAIIIGNISELSVFYKYDMKHRVGTLLTGKASDLDDDVYAGYLDYMNYILEDFISDVMYTIDNIHNDIVMHRMMHRSEIPQTNITYDVTQPLETIELSCLKD